MITELVTIIALLQFLTFGVLVGRARRKTGVKAPAVTGDPIFERAYRVQMNTMENLVIFLPALFLAAKYWPDSLVGGVGMIFIIGRYMYWRAYTVNPSTRHAGFAVAMFATLSLLILTVIGIIMAWTGYELVKLTM